MIDGGLIMTIICYLYIIAFIAESSISNSKKRNIIDWFSNNIFGVKIWHREPKDRVHMQYIDRTDMLKCSVEMEATTELIRFGMTEAELKQKMARELIQGYLLRHIEEQINQNPSLLLFTKDEFRQRYDEVINLKFTYYLDTKQAQRNKELLESNYGRDRKIML